MMLETLTIAEWIALAVGWIGHTCVCCFLLNDMYGRALPKKLLRIYRLLTGLLILLGYPLMIAWLLQGYPHRRDGQSLSISWLVPAVYVAGCAALGGIVFPIITIARLMRNTPAAVIRTQSHVIDFAQRHGRALVGDGHWHWLARLPGNDIFRVEFTRITLALPQMPRGWDGLTLLLLGDFHFHGTPAREYFEAILDEIERSPPPDVVALVGDYLDRDEHRAWLAPLLSRLKWTEAGLAILGNHDAQHDPESTRAELRRLGFTLISNRCEDITIRGERCLAIGHEGPWFRPGPELAGLDARQFRLCLSHTPDNFYPAARHGIDLMLAGHVHGGQIRVPIIGSIFVPSRYGRRFDQGVFQRQKSVMVVTRGLSGREPIRFRCPPQVIRITLTCGE